MNKQKIIKKETLSLRNLDKTLLDSGISRVVNVKKQDARNRNPILFCKWITENPRLSFGITLGAQLFMIALVGILFAVKYDIITFNLDRLPLNIDSDTDYLRSLAWSNRNNDSNQIIKRGVNVSSHVPRQTQLKEFLELHFESSENNIFTKENLILIRRVEEEFFNLTTYQSDYCLRDFTTGECVKPRSITQFFDGTYSTLNALFNDPEYDNINTVLNLANTLNQTKPILQYHLGKDAVIDSSIVFSKATRSMLYFGFPLNNYNNLTDRQEEQEERLKQFLLETGGVSEIGNKYFTNGVGSMQFYYQNFTLFVAAILSSVLSDMMKVGFSFLFIAVFMRIQTGSFWVTLFSLLSIFSGFCGTNLVYRIVFGIKYFGPFHVLALFIILGIGADDVFVFFDTWKEIQSYDYKSLAHRLSDCYRRAALATMYTSLTTALAFAVSCSSPFLAIWSFGAFSCLLVVINYFSVVTFIPCVIITYQIYFADTCQCLKKKKTPIHANDNPTLEESNTKQDVEKFPSTSEAASLPLSVEHNKLNITETSSTTNEKELEAGENDRQVKKSNNLESVSLTMVSQMPSMNTAVHFFNHYFFKFVMHKWIRWIIISTFLLLTAVSIYFATELKINEAQEEFLKKSTNFGKYLERRNIAFKTSNDNKNDKVFIVWGLKQQDLSICSLSDPKCVGQTVWDENFYINDTVIQQAIWDFCTDLKSLPSSKVEELKINRNLLTNEPEILCFAHDLELFLQEEQARKLAPSFTVDKYPSGLSVLFPVNESVTQNIIYYNSIYNNSGITNNLKRQFELVLSFWLYNGFSSNSNNLKTYALYLGESYEASSSIETTLPGSDIPYFFGNKLKYAAIVVNTTLEMTMDFPSGLATRVKWEDYVSEKIKLMPDPLKNGFQCAGNLWHWFKVQELLSNTAINGIAIGLSVALPVLILATMNWITGLIATMVIGCVVTVVVGSITMIGWKLGVMESLNLVLVVGLAVDYVVHLAEAYARSQHKYRAGRTRDALREAGVSVLSGATTTLGASFILLFGEVTFFSKFGVFVFTTIGAAIAYALLFFTAVMGVVGPEAETGSLKAIYKKVCASKT